MTRKRAAALALSILSLAHLPAQAQQSEPRPERWYRVELLVFSNEPGLSGAGEEWPATPQLAYPDAHRFLVNEDQIEANLAGLKADSEISSTGVQTITIRSELEEDNPPITETAPDIPSPEAAPGSETATPTAAVEEELPTTPTPFITLPRSELEFAGPAALMQRRGGRQTLFHEAWLQPVLERSDAIPLVLDRSGDTQEWPRLQGSVLLHISRYLHIESQLWLNTPGNYLPGSWRMPAPPLGPASLVLIEPEEEATEAEDAAEELPWYEQDSASGYSISGDDTEGEIADAGPQYPWRHAVLLDEKRRMRSNEVHYLDHPMLGIVVKLTPVSSEELETLALAEYDAKAANLDGQVSANQSL